MSARKLGRGLDSLIRKTEEAKPTVARSDGLEVRHLDPKQIRVNRSQPRTHFDDQALRELAASIKNEGILQPLVVRPDEAGGYELVAGERRLRASLNLGLASVPVVIKAIAPERLLGLALIENIQRSDLNPVELALAYRKLQQTHGFTQEQVAEHLGKKRSSIANTLRFLELEEPIRTALSTGRIAAGHAKLLLSIEEGPERMSLFEQTIEGSWGVRRLDEAIRTWRGEPIAAPPKKASGKSGGGSKAKKPASIVQQEQELERALGTKVEIQSRGERGKFVVEFFSNEDYERIRRKLLS